MTIKISRKNYVVFILFLIGVFSIFVYYSKTLREMHDTEEAGNSPILDKYYYYGDSEKERPVRKP